MYSCFNYFGLSCDQPFALCLVNQTQYCLLERRGNSSQRTTLIFYADLFVGFCCSVSYCNRAVDKLGFGESDDDCFGR